LISLEVDICCTKVTIFFNYHYFYYFRRN